MLQVTHDDNLYARQQILEYMHLWPPSKSARGCKLEMWRYWMGKRLNPLYIAMRKRLIAGIDFKNKKYIAQLGKTARKFADRREIVAECDKLIQMYET